MKKHRRREALADVYMVSGQWIAMISRFHLVKWNFIQLSFDPGTILDYARTFPQFGKAPWSSCDIKDRAGNLTLSVHLMEITFPNPSTPRHDRNPKRRINYGLSGQRELADQGQSWHRSILDLVPRLNKYLRTFGDWGRAEIDEVHLWIFPESDGRWYLGEGFCKLIHLIFATDKEVMNP